MRLASWLAALTVVAALGLGAGSAAAEMSNTRVPFSFELQTCAGEFVTITGTLHELTREEVDAAGGLQILGHHTFHGEGTTVSGVKYIVFLSSTFVAYDLAGGASTFTNTVPSVLIRQGESVAADDSITRVALHFSTNANGDIVANFENGKGDCQ
jgi:hypothetical protein